MEYLLCIVEQGFVSALNIGLNIWLIRAGGAELSGTYSFWLNVALLTGSAQFGLIVCHLAPLPPGPGTMPERHTAERSLLAASLAFTLLAAAISAGLVALSGASGPRLTGAILLVPAYLTYQYARALAFSRGAVLTATLLSSAVVALTGAGLALDYRFWSANAANPVLLISAAAYGLSAMVATWRLAGGLLPSLADLRRYLPYASMSRWSVIGTICFEAMNRAPSFAVAGWFGAAALGRMSATQIPARPPILLVASLMPALRNELARRRGAGDWQGFARQTLVSGLLGVGLGALWAIPVGLGWTFLAHWLFHDRFADDIDIGLLWAASSALGGLTCVMATAFQVCGAFRMIGLADLAGAAGTALGLAVLMPRFGVAGSVEGIILGQVCYLTIMIGQWQWLRGLMPGFEQRPRRGRLPSLPRHEQACSPNG